MIKLLIHGLLCLLSGFFSLCLLKIGCTPFPAEQLPSPHKAKIEAPAHALIYTDDELFVTRWQDSKGKDMEQIPPETWATESEVPGSVPIMIFEVMLPRVDLIILRSDQVLVAFNVPLTSRPAWPTDIKTDRIEINREERELVFYPKGGDNRRDLAQVGSLILSVVCLCFLFAALFAFDEWRIKRN